MPAISVVMITLNEAHAVGKVIRDIQAAVAGLDAEILLVDSSKDRTPEIAEAAGARVVRQFPPQGYGHAMARALSESRGGFYPSGGVSGQSRNRGRRTSSVHSRCQPHPQYG